MNITEKIIAKHAKKEKVVPGEIVEVDVDYCMANDATICLNIDIFKNKFGFKKVWDPAKVVFLIEHQLPADSVNTSESHKKIREFSHAQGVQLHERDGVCHQVMFEKYVKPGQLIVAADSHTCSYGCLGAFSTGMGSTDIAAVMGSGKTWLKVPETILVDLSGKLKPGVYAKDVILKLCGEITAAGATYKSIEFTGSLIKNLSISERFTLCNMVVEMGGKSAMIAPDQTIKECYQAQDIDWKLLQPDADAKYEKVLKYDVSKLEPQVACPHFVDNVKNLKELLDTPIDQGFIGSCTNGRLDDLRIAARILHHKKIHPNVRLLVTPASVTVYQRALKEGLIDIFLEAGAIINHPGCSTCWGACQGVMASGQTLISTANRNFKGRAGSPESKIYLASPATVAASVVEGKIVDPRRYL
ncbi:3-isopropylmalate dehydratase large subunit [bacterium]|jgi:3-isopropylmalate/(R)-2-methylmalate dehydratase large subunit|nr:3-isopropylmalate dehydratase large subunit [bacterium]MBT3581403.1 3-isopropylmalate dehydratase large subunit [bacterium]MBT4551496.1 3-isopropylmalate dehydratase large subunit [bacterium]MBT7087789.1 3-isopropylmalate dehydratase large subunit [bacterium]